MLVRLPSLSLDYLVYVILWMTEINDQSAELNRWIQEGRSTSLTCSNYLSSEGDNRF